MPSIIEGDIQLLRYPPHVIIIWGDGKILKKGGINKRGGGDDLKKGGDNTPFQAMILSENVRKSLGIVFSIFGSWKVRSYEFMLVHAFLCLS